MSFSDEQAWEGDKYRLVIRTYSKDSSFYRVIVERRMGPFWLPMGELKDILKLLKNLEISPDDFLSEWVERTKGTK